MGGGTVQRAEGFLPEVLAAYDFGGPAERTDRWGNGHINDTFCVQTAGPGRRYILQRISPVAFPRPDLVMENVVNVTDFLQKAVSEAGGDPAREALTVIRTRTGDAFHRDQAGCVWRAFSYIENTRCFERAETPALFAAVGRMFGRFQRMLSGYPADTLHETIPRFHDTEDRLQRFKEVLAADPMGRNADCRAEIDFVLAREADCSVALQAQREGKLPLRVTHNDTKLNNVLMDGERDEGLCVIDLDTVMPGLAINDFGDAIRFGANHCDEDERDLSRVALDLEMFESFTRAFLEGCGGVLTEDEIDYLPWGAKLMTLECGTRFLKDHLEGDVYFHISRPGQNLDRARTQFKLVSDMEAGWDALNAIVARCRQP